MAIVGRGRERVVGRVRVYYMSGQSWRAPLSKNWEFADQGTITRQQVDRPLLPNRNHSCVCSVTVLCVRRGVHLKMSQRQDTISPSPCPHPTQIRKRTIQIRPCAIPQRVSSRVYLDPYRHAYECLGSSTRAQQTREDCLRFRRLSAHSGARPVGETRGTMVYFVFTQNSSNASAVNSLPSSSFPKTPATHRLHHQLPTFFVFPQNSSNASNASSTTYLLRLSPKLQQRIAVIVERDRLHQLRPPSTTPAVHS